VDWNISLLMALRRSLRKLALDANVWENDKFGKMESSDIYSIMGRVEMLVVVVRGGALSLSLSSPWREVDDDKDDNDDDDRRCSVGQVDRSRSGAFSLED